MKKLLMGADIFPPYQYYDDAGQPRGSDYETVKRCLENAGYEVDFEFGDWTDVFGGYEDGRIDGLFQLMKTPEREEIMVFSKPFRDSVTTAFAADPSLKIDSFGDIQAKGLKVSVVRGFNLGCAVDGMPDECKVFFDNQDDMLDAVINGQADLSVIDLGVGDYLLGQRPGVTLHEIPAVRFERALYVSFRDPAVRDDFDSQL